MRGKILPSRSARSQSSDSARCGDYTDRARSAQLELKMRHCGGLKFSAHLHADTKSAMRISSNKVEQLTSTNHPHRPIGF